jgi:hypothetical protein
MRNIIPLMCFAVWFPACSYKEGSTGSRQVSENFEVADAGSFFVDERAPSTEVFNAAMKAALAGDQAKVTYVLSLARYTDGEGALLYGALLMKVKAFIGVSRFKRAFNNLSEEDRFSVKSNMKSAEKLRVFVEKRQNTE